MERVNNRKPLRMIANRSLLSTKGKSFVAVLAIFLTTVMFTALFTVGGSLVSKLQEETMRQVGGNSHAGIKYLTQEEYDILKNDSEIRDVSYRITVGDLVNDELKKINTEVYWFEDKEAEMTFCYPEVGSMPKNPDDFVTSDIVLNALGVPCEVGEKVRLKIAIGENIVEQDFTLSGYYTGDSVSAAQMAAVSKAFQEQYAPVPTESALKYGPISSDDYTGRIMADFNFDSTFSLEKKVGALLIRCGFPEETNVGINWGYMSSDFDSSTVVLVVVILTVIFLSGYMIIYNIFYISVYTDIRNYGLLKTVGTTGKQLKKIVRRQADILSLIGIPAGLVLGVLIGKIILPVIMNGVLNSIQSTDSSIVLSPFIFIGAALFSWLTVRISCIKPCKMAASVTPIEALRATEGSDSKRKKAADSKKTGKVTPFSMAYGNIRRSNNRTIIVVLSLSLGLILLNSIYSLINGFDMDLYIADSSISDYMVTDYTVVETSASEKNLNGITDDFLSALESREGLKQVSNVYALNYAPEFTDSDWDKMYERVFSTDLFKNDSFVLQLTQMNDMTIDEWLQDIREGQIDVYVYGTSELVFNKIEPISGSLDWEKFKSGNYVITGSFGYSDESDNKIEYFHPGEKVTIISENGKSKEFEVMAVADIPYAAGPHSSSLYNCDYILPEDEFLDLFGDCQPMATLFNVENDSTDEFDVWLEHYCSVVNSDLNYTSKATILEEYETFISVFNIVGSVIVFILILIGILNFMNTMFTSVITRKKQLAMLEAVGMTCGQQRKMLIFEGCFYTAASAVVSLVLGALINVTVIRAMGNVFFFYMWKFTIMPILVFIPVMLVISVIVPIICYRQITKSSVVERMRVQE